MKTEHAIAALTGQFAEDTKFRHVGEEAIGGGLTEAKAVCYFS